MDIGIHLPSHRGVANGDAIRGFAVRADELGYELLWVSDHVVLDDSAENEYRINIYDPFEVLAYAAALTTRPRLGTSVLVVPNRKAIVQAKAWSTLDQLSNGRAIVGLGSGSLPTEMRALGDRWEDRGRITDEYIEAMLKLWTEDFPSYDGKFCKFDHIRFEPKPVQKPHPPLWIGGITPRALQRVIRWADVWHCNVTDASKIPERLDYIREKSGREIPVTLRGMARLSTTKDRNAGDPLDLRRRPITFYGTADQIAEKIDSFAKVGVSGIVIDPLADHIDTHLEVIEVLATALGITRNADAR